MFQQQVKIICVKHFCGKGMKLIDESVSESVANISVIKKSVILHL